MRYGQDYGTSRRRYGSYDYRGEGYGRQGAQGGNPRGRERNVGFGGWERGGGMRGGSIENRWGGYGRDYTGGRRFPRSQGSFGHYRAYDVAGGYGINGQTDRIRGPGGDRFRGRRW